MEKWKFVFENGVKTAINFGNGEEDIIMKVWLEENYIRVRNDTDCDDIGIPREVFATLFG